MARSRGREWRFHTRLAGGGRSRRLQVERLEERRLLAACPASQMVADGELVLTQPVLEVAATSQATALPDLGEIHGQLRVQGRVGGRDREDLFRFSLDAPAQLDLRLGGVGRSQLDADLDLFLYDARGRRLQAGTRPGTGAETFSQELPAGDYFLRVAPWRTAASRYELTIHATPLSPPDSAGSTVSTARDLGAVGPASLDIEEWVGQGDARDVFSFQVTRPGQLELSVGGLQGNLDVWLVDDAASILARGIQQGTASERLARDVQAGRYYVIVQSPDGSSSGFQLTLQLHAASPPPALPSPDPGNPPPTEPATPETSPDNSLPGGTEPGVPEPAPGMPVQPFPQVADLGGWDAWGLNAISAPEAWAHGFEGQGVVVAVVDTGLDWTHPDLAGQLWQNPGEIAGNGVDDDGNGWVDDVHGWDFASGDAVPLDANGHGTHVAGIIAAARDGVGSTGVAPRTQLMPIQVLGSDGSGSSSWVAAGIRYAVQQGADIINLSLGGSYSADILAALSFAAAQDVLVVAAAGNESAASPNYPARFSSQLTNVLSVGAFDSSGRRASFSNRVGTSGAVQVDAPGAPIHSTYPAGRYADLQGTSMAAPHVAGLAALALSANPALSAADLRSLIVAGAVEATPDSDSRGAIDAAWTVALAAAYQPPGVLAASMGSSPIDSGDVPTVAAQIAELLPSPALPWPPPVQLADRAGSAGKHALDKAASRAPRELPDRRLQRQAERTSSLPTAAPPPADSTPAAGRPSSFGVASAVQLAALDEFWAGYAEAERVSRQVGDNVGVSGLLG